MSKIILFYHFRDFENDGFPHHLSVRPAKKPMDVYTILNWTTLRIQVASDIIQLAQKLIVDADKNFEYIHNSNYFRFRHKTDAMLIKISLDIDKYV